MNAESFHFEILTPCFCGGAEPDRQAEIRAPSIRGQLRWWFRTLGAFQSLAPMSAAKQEAMIFGSTAGAGSAGKLTVRVAPPSGRLLVDSLDHEIPGMSDPEGYLLFPLRQQIRKKSALSSFTMNVQWRGRPDLWEDIRAMVAVFANLGALGFRQRRAMGALALSAPGISLQEAMHRFSRPDGVRITETRDPRLTNSTDCVRALARWLRGWRQHGQLSRRWDKHSNRWLPIPEQQKEQCRTQPGFPFARRDHNEGLSVQGTQPADPDPETPAGQRGETFRPALGLPIVQYFSSIGDREDRPVARSRATVNWEWNWNREKKRAEGRFASPVLLRPHRDIRGDWHALVIFVDAHQWPDEKQVFLNGRPHAVSLDLYEAMKEPHGWLPDGRPGLLKPFP